MNGLNVTGTVRAKVVLFGELCFEFCDSVFGASSVLIGLDFMSLVSKLSWNCTITVEDVSSVGN